jgi:hypothetical protein
MIDTFSLVRAGARCAGVTLLLTVCAAGPTSAADAGPWSQPATLGSCVGNGPPHVVFPSNKPNHATGPGAIVWSASAGCPGGEGARVARVGVGDFPDAPTVPSTDRDRDIAPRGPLTVSAGPHGKIVIAGKSLQKPDDALVIQGRSYGPFTPLWRIVGNPSPLALATGYLGDVALASPPAVGRDTGGLRVHVERFFGAELRPRVAASSWGTRSASALTVALDYRTDALAVWAQAGSLWAHYLPTAGAAQPVRKLAAVGPGLKIAALLSDDRQATVAWSEQREGVTSVYLDRSGAGVRFGRPRLLERFANPYGMPDPAASPLLVRLSSESVMLAWAGASAGHWVVRTAAVDFHGVGAADTVSAPGSDALLASLAPGPDGDAALLWTEPQSGSAAGGQEAIYSARGVDVYPDTTAFGAPEMVAAAGPYSDPTVAIDPASDRSVVAWLGERGALQYAVRSPPGGSR